MKKLAFYLIGTVLAVWLVSCKKDSVTDFQQLDDESLVTSISDDRDKQETDPSTLPAEVLNYVSENDFDTYVDAAYFADGKGYEVVLANEERVFFNLARRVLIHRLNDRIGPCGRLLRGEVIPVANLRPAIVEYIGEHYPDAQILRAKRQGNRVIVMLSGHILLVFTEAGVFEVDGIQWVDCRPCTGGVDALPAAVKTQIETRLPGAEIKRVCRRGDRIVVGVFVGDQRRILVYDNNWNFLFMVP